MQAQIKRQGTAGARQQQRVSRTSCTRSSFVSVRAQQQQQQQEKAQQTSRRDALLLGAATFALPLVVPSIASADSKYNLKYLPVDNLGAFQKADQRKEYVDRAQEAIMTHLSAADAPACVRLALLDAGTYDAVTKAGGATGAIAARAPDSVKDVVEKLRKAKKDIDEGDKTGAGPISWADLIYLAGKATTQAGWKAAKISKAGEKAAAQSGNPWPVTLGRLDSDEIGPNKVPSAEASVEEITAYLQALGTKPGSTGGPFGPKPAFWERPGFLLWTAAAADPAAEEARFAQSSQPYADIKRGYDISRETVSRTDFEMDFAAVYNKLTGLGAKINPKAYLYPQPILAPKL